VRERYEMMVDCETRYQPSHILFLDCRRDGKIFRNQVLIERMREEMVDGGEE